jgi:hypothetical protein
VCSGLAGEACPDDSYADASTVCNPGSGDLCDPDEMCTGNPDEACPDDGVADQGTICNEGSGDACDPDEVCSGNADEACPDDSFEPDTRQFVTRVPAICAIPTSSARVKLTPLARTMT